MKTLKEIQNKAREEFKSNFPTKEQIFESTGKGWYFTKYFTEKLDSLISQTAEATMDAMRGEEMTEGDGWDVAFDKYRCCPGDDIATGNNRLISNQEKKWEEFNKKI